MIHVRFLRLCLASICCNLLAVVFVVHTGHAVDTPTIAPFGNNLFQGHFTNTAASVLQPGDRVLVRLWNGSNLDETLTIAPDGTLTLSAPENLGAIPVAGLPLNPPEALEQSLRSKLNAAGFADIQVYARPLDAQAVSVFVTGYVPRPGKYTGQHSDSLLAFLDRAGGIDSRGSFRSVHLLRNGELVADVDLYPFILHGDLPRLRFQNGDTVVVREKGPTVLANGDIRNTARFEFRSNAMGSELVRLADPLPKVSHVSVTGSRNGAPYSQYMPLADFLRAPLRNGDQVRCIADAPGNTITITVEGAIRGASVFPVQRNTRLSEVRNYISIDPDRANLSALHIKRKSVAARQKKAIDDALRRLEQNAYTATSASPDEAQIRAKEAEMISNFVKQAREVQPEGIVVVSSSGNVADLALEDGDVIVIPPKNDIVLISGEVMMPQAVVWSSSKDMDDYISAAGGFSNRADTSNLLVMRPSGELFPGASKVSAGDQVLVLPRVESKGLQSIKDISQILYQVAVACKVIIDLSML